jgi:hypothetical protein
VGAETVLAFVERNCELGSTIHTDGPRGEAARRKRANPYSTSAITNAPAPRGGRATAKP